MVICSLVICDLRRCVGFARTASLRCRAPFTAPKPHLTLHSHSTQSCPCARVGSNVEVMQTVSEAIAATRAQEDLLAAPSPSSQSVVASQGSSEDGRANSPRPNSPSSPSTSKPRVRATQVEAAPFGASPLLRSARSH